MLYTYPHPEIPIQSIQSNPIHPLIAPRCYICLWCVIKVKIPSDCSRSVTLKEAQEQLSLQQWTDTLTSFPFWKRGLRWILKTVSGSSWERWDDKHTPVTQKETLWAFHRFYHVHSAAAGLGHGKTKWWIQRTSWQSSTRQGRNSCCSSEYLLTKVSNDSKYLYQEYLLTKVSNYSKYLCRKYLLTNVRNDSKYLYQKYFLTKVNDDSKYLYQKYLLTMVRN